MAKISLKEALSKRKQSEFTFTGFTFVYDQNNKKIAVLELDEPIPLVSGSQSISDGETTEKLDAFDVTHVKIHEDDMNEGIVVEDDGSGEVSTDGLRLDVSRSGEVWLRSKSFAASGQEFRRSRTSERDQNVLQKLREARGNAVKTMTGKPGAKVNPVETTN